MASDKENTCSSVTEEDLVEEKLAYLDQRYTQEIKHLFRKYPEVIANSFDDVRPSKVDEKHSFELISEKPIFQKLRRLPPAYSDIVRNKVKRMLEAGIITPVESSWTSPVVLATKRTAFPGFV